MVFVWMPQYSQSAIAFLDIGSACCLGYFENGIVVFYRSHIGLLLHSLVLDCFGSLVMYATGASQVIVRYYHG